MAVPGPSLEAEGDSQRLIELGESGRPETTATASENLLREREDAVTVRGTVVLEAFVRSQPNFSNVTVKGTGHQHAKD